MRRIRLSNSEKIWKSFDEQLELMKSRGLIIEDDVKALNYLERVGYYTLSGYWHPLRKSCAEDPRVKKNIFYDDSYFSDVIKLYVFDKKLRLIALDALERIEIALRVDISHQLGSHDPHAHHIPELLSSGFVNNKIKKGRNAGKTGYEVWCEKYQSSLSNNSKKPFIKHYTENYERLPVWVSSEIWDFGMLSRLYSGMKHKDKTIISNKYGAEHCGVMASWIISLNFVRNLCAHHSRLWNHNIVDRTREITNDDFLGSLNKSRIFVYFCIMQKMLNVICPNSTWGERFKSLLLEFNDIRSEKISLNSAGFVPGWEDAQLWQRG
jgi:abortive infection bacteriophage resistance protein|tara:strand:- start:1098 stop:2066 length:969 start_codon:yes stop_codon:yes gene_type:complete